MLHDAVLGAAPVLVVAALVFGPASAWLGARQQRNPAIWLAFGAVLGPLALGILFLAPPARCPSCAEPTAGFETRCATCGTDLDTRAGPTAPAEARSQSSVEATATPPGAPAGAIGAPILRSLPDPAGSGKGRQREGARRADTPGDAQPARLSAVGARRPQTGPTVPGTILDGSQLDVTLLAMAVLVRGSGPLKPGSRYVIARTHDRLLIIGPVEAADEHVELSLPLAGIEANFVADRLVISAVGEDRARRSTVIAFQSVASLIGRAVDEAIMEAADPVSIAAARP